MDTPPSNSQRRRFYRIAYPPRLAPAMIIEGRTFRIVDLCEHGVRINNPLKIRLPEDLFQAVIRLHDQETIQVTGRVIRTQTSQVAFVLVSGIPYKKIIAEQSFLRQLERG